MEIEIKRGLDIPIAGQPVQAIKPGPPIKAVAILGDDYVGMRPTMLVAVGDRVALGQPVFSDKKNEGVIYTAPGCGVVKGINRGEKRRFLSLEIELDGDEQVTFGATNDVGSLDREAVQKKLVDSGLWTSLRKRPFDRVPELDGTPHSVFVTATDSNPLAADPELIIAENKDRFVAGVAAVSKLTSGKTYVCTRGDSRAPGSDLPNVQFVQFRGPHPSGLAGTHIHFLDPVGPNKTVWYLNYQDVIAIGHLFLTGELMTERVVALGGPRVADPTLYRTRLGACIDELVEGRIERAHTRVISGSILCGHRATPPVNYLGRYHLQVAALEEGDKREFLGWQKPGFDKFSVTNIYAGSLMHGKKFAFTTSLNGSHRAMVPVETYERVMPLDILPTQLLRSLIVRDTEEAQLLGCLELAEEDVGLCTFVCPGKYDYASILRDNLTRIEKEG